MLRRILGALVMLAGSVLVFAHFFIIADPPPGATWGGPRQYLDLAVGIPLLAVGFYWLIKRSAS